jgi:hypothetical protein
MHITHQTGGPKKKVKKSFLRTVLEFVLFLTWLVCTGFAGYYMGYDPSKISCPEVQGLDAKIRASVVAPTPATAVQQISEPCPTEVEHPVTSSSNNIVLPPLHKPEGYSFEELDRLWSCSHAVGNMSELHEQILPANIHMEKTKWKSIITVEPKAFFDKYLSQYPGDTRAVQPVIVFSHKPLNSFEEMGEVCKVLDIAVVPDKPGTCVAVTETFHDVASYHMLHADRQADGTFALTSNFVDGRVLPEEPAYAAARALILDFFKYGEEVQQAMKAVPKHPKGNVVVGVFVDDAVDMELFLNSYASANRQGVSKGKFCVFTTSQQVNDDMSKSGIKVIHLPQLANVGRSGSTSPLNAKLRRYFIQAWLAFATANQLLKVLWQTPATIWFDRPDNIVHANPAVETLWVFKGREDQRSAPFFISFDFFLAEGTERPVHLLHELLMHFDLIMAWDSLDAVTAYRLSENNSRYGTTVFVLPPTKVLHSELMNHNPEKLRHAAQSEQHPQVIVIPKNYEDVTQTQQILRDAGLWFL